MAKGEEGKKTGGRVRKAIRKAVKRGATIKSIATAANRSPGVISDILSGEIKNPPASILPRISKAKAKKKVKK